MSEDDDIINKYIELNNDLRKIDYKNDNVLKSKLIESNDEVNLTKLKYYKLKNFINIYNNDDKSLLINSKSETTTKSAAPVPTSAAAPAATIAAIVTTVTAPSAPSAP